ncbi:hypothetical protein V6N13_129439 [Hibiscus sabdariffa]|uniref:Uncharacterized protein n=1 Tax=Hibiscus sabdariffa TaxID=183260 RepID=A0ABR2SL89_9ROSI
MMLQLTKERDVLDRCMHGKHICKMLGHLLPQNPMAMPDWNLGRRLWRARIKEVSSSLPASSVLVARPTQIRLGERVDRSLVGRRWLLFPVLSVSLQPTVVALTGSRFQFHGLTGSGVLAARVGHPACLIIFQVLT